MKLKRAISIALMLMLLLSLLPVGAANADSWPATITNETGCPNSPDDGHHLYTLRSSTNADCTHGGSAKYACRYCNAEKNLTSDPLGHDWGEWKTLQEPTCTEKGEQRRVCGRCKAEEHRDVAALGHDWDSGTVTKQAACTEAGSKTVTCQRCGAKETQSIPALGHKWDGGKVTKEPTATEPGIRTYTCERNHSHTYTEEIPPTGGSSDDNAEYGLKYEIWYPEGREESYPYYSGDDGNAPHVPFCLRATNTGNRKLFVEYRYSFNYTGNVYTNSTKNVLEPGQNDYEDLNQTGYTGMLVVSADNCVPEPSDSLFAGTFYYDTWAVGYDYEEYVKNNYKTYGLTHVCVSNHVLEEFKIDKPDEAIYGLTQTITQTSPIKEAYPHDGGDLNNSERVDYKTTIRNTGNRKLITAHCYQYSNEDVSKWFFAYTIDENESYTNDNRSFKVWSKHMTPDPQDSPYAGTVTYTTWVVGYDYEEYVNNGNSIDGLTPKCETEHYTFTCKIRKPGEAETGEPYMTVDLQNYSSADPNGFQLGERIEFYTLSNFKEDQETGQQTTGLKLHCDSALDTSFAKIENGVAIFEDYSDWIFGKYDVHTAFEAGYFKHIITQEDVDRGYFDCIVYATYKNLQTGKEYTVYSNLVRVPVIKNPSLPMAQKEITSTPANGTYYVAGEQITYTVTVKNNTGKTFKNLKVEDKGETIGTIDTLAPGDSQTFTVPAYTVKSYDVIVGEVKNTATVSGTDEFGAAVSFTSNTVTAYTKDPTEEDGDPYSEILGKNAQLSIKKVETSTPNNGLYYVEGETISYTITVTNTGTEPIDGAIVRDSLQKENLGVIGTVGALAAGASQTLTFSYTVTAADVEHGKVTNYAIADWTFGGVSGEPVQSEKVISYTSEEGLLTGGDDGGFTPYAGGDDACRLELNNTAGSEANYTLTHCAAHTGIAHDALQWRMAIEAEYQKLYEMAWGDAAAAVLLEHDKFDLFLTNYTALLNAAGNAEASDKLVNFLELYCAELCCAIHTADEALPGSLLYEMMAEFGGDAYELCETALIDGVYAEHYGDEHAPIFAAVKTDVWNAKGRQAAANVFATGRDLWQQQLDEDLGALYEGNAAVRTSVALMRAAMLGFLDGRSACFGFLYPNNPETVAEDTMDLVRRVALTVCETVEIPEYVAPTPQNPTPGEESTHIDPTNLDPNAKSAPKWLVPVLIGAGAALLVAVVGIVLAVVLSKKKRK